MKNKIKRTEKIKNNGFTLAEVLITLVIIGVIAAMTIPTLINKTNNNEYTSRLKKVYSALSQATNTIISQEGSPKEWASTNESFFNMYKKHLQVMKDCSGGKCFPDVKYKYRKGTYHDSYINRNSLFSLKLSDGTPVLFGWTDGGECSQRDTGTYDYCGIIIVDINDIKAPNAYGRDLFAFGLKENGLYPMGCDDNGSDFCSASSEGLGCTCKVIREGAINY